MKKSLLALAIAGAFSGTAFAQSSVTLFGIVDATLQRVSGQNNGSITRLSNSGYNSSRIGVRGVEDLGGGLRAGFWLEGQLFNDDGTNGTSNTNNQTTTGATGGGGLTFGRRATVSLLGGFGEVRLGRDYVPDFWNLTIMDPFGTNGVGSTLAFSAAGLNAAFFVPTVRASNSIGYFLPPNIGGVYGQVMFALGENPTENAGVSNPNDNDGRYVGGRVGWQGGPVNVAGAYGKTTYLQGAAQGDVTRMNVGVGLTFGPFKPSVFYNKIDVDTSAATDPERADILVGLVWTVGAGDIRLSYNRYDIKNTSNDGQQLSAGYVHNVSRRTAVYATYAQIDNKGTGTAFSNGRATTQAGGKTTGYEFGIRHTF
jgi:predicted porin